jgi:class 3 adenylate cyclase/tetratricopeptide (TPR) repeat protein
MRCDRCGVESPAGMRFCGACGAQLREPLRRALGEEGSAQRRHLTVMFCDLVDSTAISELLDPEDFRDVLTEYQAACARAIERFNGHVAQWIGDGVLAYFGYPQAHEDDAPRAVHAALGILEEISTLSERLATTLRAPLRARVGLHTGIVVAGVMGAGRTREQMAIVGETPHIAARLQTLASPGSVVLTDATLELVADHFEVEQVGMSTLKGISRPVAVHRVVRATHPGALRPRAYADTGMQMVDRLRELARLAEAWRRVEDGQGVLVHLCGEAGIGKSRLVRALREELRGRPSAEHLLQCSPHHPSTALYPAIRFLEQIAGLDRTQSPEQQLSAILRLADGAGLERTPAVDLLADLLSIPAGARAEPDSGLLPRDARNATLQILETLLVGDSAHGPVLLVVEDLHWADPTTVELLGRILAGLAGRPIACVVAFRREFEPPWAQSQDAVEVELGPLEGEHVREMARAAGPEALDAEAISRIESAADGVPLFVEEMVKALAGGSEAQGRMRGEPGSAVPPTLQGLLAERLDRLPGLAGVIDVAAVLGREFERGLLQALSPTTGSNFGSALAQLTAEDVLRPVEGAHSRLEFKHALLQEAAYERLLRRQRCALHGRVAELLSDHATPAWEAEPERIAHHFSRAEQPARAVEYWREAGMRALKRAAFLEATEHFRRGIESLDAARPAPDSDAERGELLTHLAAAAQAGRSPAADVDGTYVRARSAYERAGSREQLMPVIRGQWMFHLARAEYPAALTLAEEMLALAESVGRPVCLAEGHLYRGLAHMYMGHLDGARTELADAHRHHHMPEEPDHIYDAQGDTGVAALAYLAIVLWNQGEPRDALRTSARSLELAEQIEGPVTLAQAWGMRGGLLLAEGKLTELGPWLEKTLAHCAERNIGYWRTVCSLWSAWMLGRSGDPVAAAAQVRGHLGAYMDSGSRLGLPHFHVLLADLHLAARDPGPALEALRAGAEHIERTGERYHEPELQWFMGRALMAAEAPDHLAATVAFERAVDSAREQNAKLLELRAATGLALHQRALGDTCTARARLEELCRWFGADSQLADVTRARMLLDGRASPA